MTPPDPSTRLLVQATVESLQAEVRELRGRLAVAEQEREEMKALAEEAWAKRRLYFHERNEEAARRIAELEADIESRRTRCAQGPGCPCCPEPPDGWACTDCGSSGRGFHACPGRLGEDS